jgi:hypothetical protein
LSTPEKICVVSPAGRKRYLDLLKEYVLSDRGVTSWVLWENCRNAEDRAAVRELAMSDSRISVVQRPGTDGGYAAVSKFWDFPQDPDTFYIKVDDDIVFCQENLFSSLRAAAVACPDRDETLLYSPLVVNNTTCTWILKHFSAVDVPEKVRLNIFEPVAWLETELAARLHSNLLESIALGDLGRFRTRDFQIMVNRFSINFVGWFGDVSAALGQRWRIPPDLRDEEWYSAVLPTSIGRGTHVFGSLLCAHFAYRLQEEQLLRTNLLERYAQLVRS